MKDEHGTQRCKVLLTAFTVCPYTRRDPDAGQPQILNHADADEHPWRSVSSWPTSPISNTLVFQSSSGSGFQSSRPPYLYNVCPKSSVHCLSQMFFLFPFSCIFPRRRPGCAVKECLPAFLHLTCNTKRIRVYYVCLCVTVRIFRSEAVSPERCSIAPAPPHSTSHLSCCWRLASPQNL